MGDGPGKGIFKQGKAWEQISRDCLRNGVLFEDDLFPAVDTSVFFSQTPPTPFQWKRPQELVSDPQLFVGGASRFDVAQGELGDCWFLAATAGLSLDEHLLWKVIPKDQSFSQREGYCGLFRFNFWHYGKWKTIIIDDRLPTYNGRLVFVHSKEQNEFWSALLEKAYSKLHGSYEALKGGNVIEAMEDFTGGVSESIDLLQSPPPGLFKIMKTSYDRDSQLGCSINAKPGQIEAKLPTGLIAGHAYTITDVRKVNVGGREVRLIRIRNPWGQVEWNGAWSDNSREWEQIPQHQRKSLGLITDDDGEFWMEFRDFKRHFERVDMCHLGPESMTGKGKRKWEAVSQDGKWQKGATAGGCRNFPDSFWVNPQFQLVLEEEDDKDDIGDDEDDDPALAQKTGATFLVALMQKNRRTQRKMGVDNLTQGFAIYKADSGFDPSTGLPKDFFLYNASTARSPTFTNTREVSGRFKLPPGTYCIIPSTFEPNQEGDFLLRIYSMKRSSAMTIDEQSGMVDIPKQVTQKAKSVAQQPKPVAQQPKSIATKVSYNSYSAPPPQSLSPGFTQPSYFQTYAQPTFSPALSPSGYSQSQTWNQSYDYEKDFWRPRPVEDDAQTARFREFFKKLTGPDMEVDAWELQEILNAALKKDFARELQGGGFSIESCKSMVALTDEDRNGKLGFEEFRDLWQNISAWKAIFKKYDKDNSGTFDSYEMKAGLRSLGFKLSNATFGALVLRYADKKGTVTFDSFIASAIKLKFMFTTFAEKQRGGHASFGMDEFMILNLYS